jgi:hypothetical protein
MYCPGCGQKVADDTNFCPRCGFFFGALRELLATGGVPSTQYEIAQRREPSERQKGIRLGAKIIFFSLVLFIVCFGLCFLVDGPGPLFLPLTVFMTGVLWMLYARLFRDPDFNISRGVNPAIGGTRHQPMLPSPGDAFQGQYARRPTTSEIAPPSVTEHTTDFLGQK